MPRHQQIAARVVGERASRSVTFVVAAGETALGLWMLSGRLLRLCVGIQTVAIVAMNTLEIRNARDLLLSPVAMVFANTVFLCIGWYVALVTAWPCQDLALGGVRNRVASHPPGRPVGTTRASPGSESRHRIDPIERKMPILTRLLASAGEE